MVEPGFVKADSTNLPAIDVFMIAEFIKNDERFNAAEIRLVKASLSSRENYGDVAIGHVCLQTNTSTCIIKGKICPEHRVRSQKYVVTVIVDTAKEKIENALCEGCAASQGGCKHALSFLMWLHRKSENRSPTEVECYWTKPPLGTVGTSKKFLTVDELSKNKNNGKQSFADNSTFFNNIMRKSNDKQIDCQITRHAFTVSEREYYSLSFHQLMINFLQNGGKTAGEFLKFCTSQMPKDICQKIETQTKGQSSNLLWHELRYGRITASVLHEAAHCKTEDGSLILRLLGASKKFDTVAMTRGRQLEESVVKQIEKDLNIKLGKCGFVLMPDFPFLGATPDAVGDDFVVEIKCPISEKSFNNYIKNGTVSDKFKAQVHLQMFAMQKNKGLFCVADPEFEKNQKVTLLWIEFNREYINELIAKATKFWRLNVFPKMLNSLE